MKWSYGITTVPTRIVKGTFRLSIDSLRAAGFDKPRIFVDGDTNQGWLNGQYRLEYTIHEPPFKAYANWLLAILELYLREPRADRYVVFQDDIMVVKNLRQFLDASEYPKKGYWNLITYPCNIDRSPSKDYRGWYKSDQMGRGGQGLVFTREALAVLFSHKLILDHPHEHNGPRSIDGAVSRIFRDRGWVEYVHAPGLLGHREGPSIIGVRTQPEIPFIGEDFDALSLIHRGEPADAE